MLPKPCGGVPAVLDGFILRREPRLKLGNVGDSPFNIKVERI